MTTPKKPGPKPKPAEDRDSARIHVRVRPVVAAKFDELGGKAWLVPAIMRARKKEPK